MLSPEAARDAAATLPRPDGERELKFVLPDGRVDLARRWLDRICSRDPEFPAAVVWTIYYDTPRLASLGEKINSDYLKQKIRVRWYSDLDGRAAGPAFVEAKLRVGNRRFKVREALPYFCRADCRMDSSGPAPAGISFAARESWYRRPWAMAAGYLDSLSSRSLHRAAERLAGESRFGYRRRGCQPDASLGGRLYGRSGPPWSRSKARATSCPYRCVDFCSWESVRARSRSFWRSTRA